jgi:copper chaperone CopZ
MRTVITSVLSFAVLFLGTVAQMGCSSQSEAGVAEIKLPTVQCEACALTITTVLKKETGVKDVNVDLQKKLVKVSYLKAKTNQDKLESAVALAGYDANSKKANKKAYEGLPGCCKVSDK